MTGLENVFSWMKGASYTRSTYQFSHCTRSFFLCDPRASAEVNEASLEGNVSHRTRLLQGWERLPTRYAARTAARVWSNVAVSVYMSFKPA